MSEESTDDKSYRIETYIVAGMALLILGMSADEVRELNREADFERLFVESYGQKLPGDSLSLTLELMNDLGLISIDDDPFAGRYITIQKTAFSGKFKELAQPLKGSAIDVVLRGGRPWIESVYREQKFWLSLVEELKGSREDDPSLSTDTEVPASDRTVTLLHNSPERIEAETGLDGLVEIVKTNNAVAADLAEDRERISAELESARAGIRSERIRASFLRDNVLKVLRELGVKLKEKAIELGVDRLISLFERILDTFL